MVCSEVLSDLVGQLLELTFQFVFILPRREQAIVSSREVLDDGIVGIRCENPDRLGAIDLIKIAAILILTWPIVSFITKRE